VTTTIAETQMVRKLSGATPTIHRRDSNSVRLKASLNVEVQKNHKLLTRDGELSMLTKLKRPRPRDSMKNLASTSTDHSILYQSFHSTELLRCTVIPKLP
jgi:hypothetical protein